MSENVDSFGLREIPFLKEFFDSLTLAKLWKIYTDDANCAEYHVKPRLALVCEQMTLSVAITVCVLIQILVMANIKPRL